MSSLFRHFARSSNDDDPTSILPTSAGRAWQRCMRRCIAVRAIDTASSSSPHVVSRSARLPCVCLPQQPAYASSAAASTQ